MRVIRIYNNTGSDKTYVGQTISPSSYYEIQAQEWFQWSVEELLLTDIGSGEAIVNDGVTNLGISEGLDWLKDIVPKVTQIQPYTFPFSLDTSKLVPIGFGSTLTVPAFPTIKPLAHYTVPSNKTLRLIGVMFKTSASSSYLHLYTRTPLWKFSATTLATPGAPTLTAKTITGSGLTTSATYRYKIVANNALGSTIGGTEASIALTGGQNAVSLSWSVVTGAVDYKIYRTSGNGISNTQKLLSTTDLTTYTDVIPDTELDSNALVPSSNTTSGSTDGLAYAAGYGATHVVCDTVTAIASTTTLDVIYKNIYGNINYLTVTPSTSAGGQVMLQVKGATNPTDSRRVQKGTNTKEYLSDVGINDILSVGNIPVTGSFIIYGYNILFHMASDYANRWNTIYLENSLTFPSNQEVVFGVSGNAANTTATRHDVVLLGVLE
jgi:hypothetical protein